MPPPRSALSNCHIVLGVSLLWSHTDRGMWLTPGADISLLIGQLLTMPGCDWSGCWHTNMTHSGVRVTVIGRGHTGKNILLFFKLAGARFLKYFICYSTLKYLICYASSFSNFACCERSVEVCGEVSNWYLTDSKWHNESKQRIEWFSDSRPWPRPQLCPIQLSKWVLLTPARNASANQRPVSGAWWPMRVFTSDVWSWPGCPEAHWQCFNCLCIGRGRGEGGGSVQSPELSWLMLPQL